MKIYISVDMEGMAGICNTRQQLDDIDRFRKAMEENVSWVIEGIQNSSMNTTIEEITIADSHGEGRNLSYDITELDERISLINGSPRPQFMLTGLTADYDLAFFVGYHAGAGEDMGNIDHTLDSKAFYDIRINNQHMNESTLNAALAGHYGVPVPLIIGDYGLYKELILDEMMPNVNFVVTKQGLGWSAAKHKSKIVIKKEIKEAIERTLSKDVEFFGLFKIESPYLLEIDLSYRSMADVTSNLPGVKVEGRKISVSCSDYLELYNTISAINTMVSHQYPFEI